MSAPFDSVLRCLAGVCEAALKGRSRGRSTRHQNGSCPGSRRGRSPTGPRGAGRPGRSGPALQARERALTGARSLPDGTRRQRTPDSSRSELAQTTGAAGGAGGSRGTAALLARWKGVEGREREESEADAGQDQRDRDHDAEVGDRVAEVRRVERRRRAPSPSSSVLRAGVRDRIALLVRDGRRRVARTGRVLRVVSRQEAAHLRVDEPATRLEGVRSACTIGEAPRLVAGVDRLALVLRISLGLRGVVDLAVGEVGGAGSRPASATASSIDPGPSRNMSLPP